MQHGDLILAFFKSLSLRGIKILIQEKSAVVSFNNVENVSIH